MQFATNNVDTGLMESQGVGLIELTDSTAKSQYCILPGLFE